MKSIWLPRLSKKDLIRELYRVGVTLWIVIIANFALSAALIYQVHSTLGLELVRFGRTYLLGALTVGLARELVPLVVGLVVAARLGSTFAAEISAMKISEQIDALRSLAIDPLEYLVLPRFLGTVLMMIPLTVFGWLASFVGGYFAAWLVHVDMLHFMNSARAFFQYSFIVAGLIRVVFFGIFIALISCFSGLSLKEKDLNILGVGSATTRAVVASFVVVFLVYLLFAWLIKY